MDIPSLLLSFLEAALKRQSTVTVAEIKEIMSGKLNTHLAVHGNGRTMIGKRMFNFKFTVMRQPDLQRITLF